MSTKKTIGSTAALTNLRDLEAKLAAAQRTHDNEAAVGLSREVEAARCEHREARRTELLGELEGAAESARGVVAAVLELERQGSGLIEQMERAIARIRAAESEYRTVTGQSPGLMPDLGKQLREALIESDGIAARGLGPVIASLWAGPPLVGVIDPQRGVDLVDGKARQF